MTPPSHHDLEEPAPLCSKSPDGASWSPYKQLRLDDPRNSSCETASLTCSDSLNSSATDDTDDDSFRNSPDNSRNRYRRLDLHVIKDLSFDDYSLTEEKIHEPSQEQKCENRRRRVVLALPLIFTGLFLRYFRCDPPRVQPSRHHTQWKHLKHTQWKHLKRVRRMIEASPIPKSFTIRLSGSRTDLLERSVDVVTRCASVEQVQVEWKSTMRPPRNIFRHASGKVTRVEQLATNAVLVLDEDVIFTCDELERGFQLWRLNPDRMVGFFPYHHSALVRPSFMDSAQPPTMDYMTNPVLPGGGHYELISSRGAFIHKEYLESYLESVHPSQHDACRQFALSVHCTAVSSKAPLAVVADPQEQRSSDLVPLLQEWKQEEVSSCLREWIEGYEILNLPSEESTYVGA